MFIKNQLSSFLKENYPRFFYRQLRHPAKPATFEKDETILLGAETSIQTLKGYRKFVRPVWFRVFPVIRVLLELKQMSIASPNTIKLLEKTYNAPTLPCSTEEFEVLFQEEVRLHPEYFYYDDQDRPLHLIRKDRNTLSKNLHQTTSNLKKIRSYTYANGLDYENCAFLDIGCGSGDLCYQLVSHGARQAVGIDVVMNYPENYYLDRREALKLSENRCEFHLVSADRLPFPDEQFDVITSTSVIEHLGNARKSFQEMYRVLRAGGICIHSYDPLFSPRGGHSLLTLDFPWGHVRLNRSQIQEYISKIRPNEVDRANEFIREEIPDSPYYLHELQQYIIEAGFKIIGWEEGTSYTHANILDSHILNEVRQLYPEITVRDLLVDSVWIVCTK